LSSQTFTRDADQVSIDDILPAEDAADAPRNGAAAADSAAAASLRSDKRDAAGVDHAALGFCERFLELLIDLLSQTPTRRFLHAVLQVRRFFFVFVCLCVVPLQRNLWHTKSFGNPTCCCLQ
jgi:Intron-binding protein aquarius N-terminus